MGLRRRSRLLLAALLPLLITLTVVLSLCLTLLPSSSSPLPTPPGTVTYTRSSIVHPAWAPITDSPDLSRASPSDSHTFRWLFPHRNLSWLQAEFEAISDPTSARYQQYKERADILSHIGPTTEQREAVLLWLSAQGVVEEEVADYGDALEVTVTVARVESMFNTSLHHFVNADTNQSATLSLDGAIHVPEELTSALEAVRGVYNFPMLAGRMETFRSAAAREAAPAARSSSLPSARSPPSHIFKPSSFSYGPNTSHFMHSMQVEETNRACTIPLSSDPNYSGGYNTGTVLSPATLASQYSFDLRATDTSPQVTRAMVVEGFLGQAYSIADLAHFAATIGFSSPATVVDFPNSTNNANNLATYGPGGEASLDIQALYQTAPTNAQNQVFAVPANGPGNDFESTLTYIVSLPPSQIPHVVSYSYTFGYSDYSFLSGDGNRAESLLAQLALMGVTVVVAAGDDGSTAASNRGCNPNVNQLSRGTLSPYTTPMLPQYPSTSAYVLSVGETAFTYGTSNYFGLFTQGVTSPPLCNNCPADQQLNAYLCQSQLLHEEPVSTTASSGHQSTTSGGGFSTVVPTPSWQQPQVQAYLTSYCASGNANNTNGCFLPPSSYYNRGGRGFPDVVAFGGYFGIVLDGQRDGSFEGSSIAAPMWAGFISRLNEVALARSGKPLGFVNPLLYQMAAVRPSAPSTTSHVGATTSVPPGQPGDAQVGGQRARDYHSDVPARASSVRRRMGPGHRAGQPQHRRP